MAGSCPSSWHSSLAVRCLGSGRARAVLARIHLCTGIVIVARGAVGLGRVRAHPGHRIAGPYLVARSLAVHVTGSAPAQRRSGTYPSAYRRCRRCTTRRLPWRIRAHTCGRVAGARRGTGRLPCTSPPRPPRMRRSGTQWSACVQASPSLHDEPSAFAGFEHMPVAGLQVPASWHGSLAVPSSPTRPPRTPLWHCPPGVQASPSLHDVPSAIAGYEHWPVIGLQVPASWHASGGGHAFAPGACAGLARARLATDAADASSRLYTRSQRRTSGHLRSSRLRCSNPYRTPRQGLGEERAVEEGVADRVANGGGAVVRTATRVALAHAADAVAAPRNLGRERRAPLPCGRAA